MKNKKENEVKSSKKHGLTKTEMFINFLDKNRKAIYGFIGGALVAAIVATIIWPDRIATLADGTQPVAEINGEKITADALYETLKKDNDISFLLNIVDEMILFEKYEEDEEMTSELNNNAQDYYSQVGSKEEFLSQYGYESEDEFLKDLKLNYLREKYYQEYLEGLVTDKEIEDYYNENVYGDINSKHMLVMVDEDRTDEDAKKLAEEIITKLNEGKTFDEVKDEYADSITFEELGFQGFSSNIQDSYMNALKALEDGKYTTEPVKTSYGYHVIYRIEQKEKAALDDVKDLIVDNLAAEKEEADQYIAAKALIELRKENEFTFHDTVMEDKYNEYVKLINEQ